MTLSRAKHYEAVIVQLNKCKTLIALNPHNHHSTNRDWLVLCADLGNASIM